MFHTWRSYFRRASVCFTAGAVVIGAQKSQTKMISVVACESVDQPKLPVQDGLVLFQYAPCPFCNKVRIFMDYHCIPYSKVEVEPLRKKQLSWSEYKKVPVLLVNGEQINDSSVILSRLQKMMKAESNAHYREISEEEQTWISWVDNHLIHLLPSNIYRTFRESVESFDYLLDSSFEFSTKEKVMARYSGAVIMYMLCKFRLNKKYGIKDPRQDIYTAVDSFVTALGGILIVCEGSYV